MRSGARAGESESDHQRYGGKPAGSARLLSGLRGRPMASEEGTQKSLCAAIQQYLLGTTAVSAGSSRAKAPGSILERGQKAGPSSHGSSLSAPGIAGEDRGVRSIALARKIAPDLRG